MAGKKLVAALRTGTFKDSTGKEHTFDVAKLDAIAGAYNPQFFEAPEVIGHPKTDSPAWGWVKSFKREGDILFYEPGNRVPEFQKMIDLRMFKNRSIKLGADGITVKHVGWLGAMPPAVKGLPVTFKAENEGSEFEFSEASAINTIGSIFQRFREWLIAKFDQATADSIVNNYEIDELKNVELDNMPEEEMSSFAEGDAARRAQQARAKRYGIAIKEGGNVTKPSDYAEVHDDEFMDPVNYRYPMDEAHIRAAMSYWGMPKNREGYTPDEIKIMTNRMLVAAKKHNIEADKNNWNFNEGGEDMGEIERLKAELEAEKEKNRILEAENRKKEFMSFCEGLSREGKLSPAMAPAVMDFLEVLHGSEEFEFAEMDADGKEKKVKAAPAEKFKTFLTGFPKIVEFSETATKDKAAVKDEEKSVVAGIASASPKEGGK